jgi:clan AA aspartic protease
LDLTWKYSDEHRPSAPVVAATIGAFSMELLVDTGFSGGVLLPFPLFQSLGLMRRLVPEGYSAVLPDSRRLIVYTALSEVKIGSLRASTRVHSAPSLDRRLLGREALKAMVATLDGPEETLTLKLTSSPS